MRRYTVRPALPQPAARSDFSLRRKENFRWMAAIHESQGGPVVREHFPIKFTRSGIHLLGEGHVSCPPFSVSESHERLA